MSGHAAIPERTSIAIVGGGLGGWATAAALGDAAREAVLLDAGVTDDGEDASLGLARTVPALPLARLVAGHGAESAARWIAAGGRNRDLLAALDLPMRRGTARLAAMGEPADELRRSTDVLVALGGQAALAEPQDLLPSVPARFALAAHHPDDFVVDTGALVAALRARAVARGLQVARSTRVEALHDTGGVRLETSQGTLHAEIAVIATGFDLPRLVPFCRFKIVGLRAQWLAARPHPEPRRLPTTGWSDAEGYERWCEVGPEEVRLSGSRELPLKRELAARSGTSDEVQALLERNLREFPHLASSTVTARGASVQAVPCDGLPIVGAVPGRPRVLVLGGFGREAPGQALVAGEIVAQLVTRGRAEHALAYSPRRFL